MTRAGRDIAFSMECDVTGLGDFRRGPGRAAALLLVVTTLAGCSVFRVEEASQAEPPKPQYAEPLATHTFPYDPKIGRAHV